MPNNEIVAALFEAKKKFPKLFKNKTVNTGKFSFRYADLESISDAIVPLLQEHDIMLLQPTRTVADGSAVSTLLIHVPSGDFIQSDGILLPKNIVPRELGAAVTFFRRYDLVSFLALIADDDLDAPEFTSDVQAPPERAAKPAVDHKPAEGTSDPRPGKKDDDSTTLQDRKEFSERLKKFKIADAEKLHDFVLKTSGASNGKAVTKSQWISILKKLEEAEKSNKLAELVGA